MSVYRKAKGRATLDMIIRRGGTRHVRICDDCHIERNADEPMFWVRYSGARFLCRKCLLKRPLLYFIDWLRRFFR